MKQARTSRSAAQARVARTGIVTRIVNWAQGVGRVRAIVVGLAPALALAVLGRWYVIAPAEAGNVALAAENSRLQQENQADRAIEQTREAFEAEFRRVVLLYGQARELVPASIEVPNVLAQVQEAARRERVVLSAFDAISKQDVRSPAADRLYEREVPATVVGSYPQVVAFFRDVARLPRIAQISDLALTSVRDRVAVSFKLSVYYAPSPAELPPLPAKLEASLSSREGVSVSANKGVNR